MPADNGKSPAGGDGHAPIPTLVGVGLRPAHYASILEARPTIDWFEVHPENFMIAGGPSLAILEKVRTTHPLSFHAVGLSPGSHRTPDAEHLRRFRHLIDRFRPALVSDHLAWSSDGDVCLPDLLPVPYTSDALDRVAANVGRIQDTLGRSILIENPSLYLRHVRAEMDETEFLAALASRTGCGVLLDVNNVYVSAMNLGFDAEAYIERLPFGIVGEIHLAGHKTEAGPHGTVRIDDHGSAVADPVWRLYERAIRRFGAVPTLIEWDTDVPALDVLVAEAAKAKAAANGALRARGSHAA